MLLGKSALSQAKAELPVKPVAVKTIRAILSGDTVYLTSITDPRGILVGYDGIRHSAADFRKDLTDHTGLYCEIFKGPCKTPHNPDWTLANALTVPKPEPPLDLRVHTHGNTTRVDYIEPGGGDLVVSFFYRLQGGRWLLYNIGFV